jgi:hypothetical protein
MIFDQTADIQFIGGTGESKAMIVYDRSGYAKVGILWSEDEVGPEDI